MLNSRSLAASDAAEVGAPSKPTIVLVHGAFAESSSWNKVTTQLLAHGYPVVAAANPLRGLKADCAYIARVLQSIRGPIVAVGHSYGGSVITGAAFGNPNVQALVYVAGLAPDSGESAVDISERFTGSTLGPALAPPVELPDGGKDLYIQSDRFHAQFAADVPEIEAKIMAAVQRPVTELALHEASGPAAWKTVPSWFIFGSLDKNITEAAHTFMGQRAKARAVVIVQGASHALMVSHADQVERLIERAAQTRGEEPFERETSPVAPKATAKSQSEGANFEPAPVVPIASQPPARLIVDSPLPEQLAKGYVVVRYRVENLRILPVYGASALEVSPRIGHLHVTVDDLPWHWLDASGQPISINGLPPGPHRLQIELESPIHKLVESATVQFEIPLRPKAAQ